MQEQLSQIILTVNAGSSSLKLAAFLASTMNLEWECEAENLGQPNAFCKTRTLGTETEIPLAGNASRATAVAHVLEIATATLGQYTVKAVGHRLVHGGGVFNDVTELSPENITKLESLIDFDPTHLPAALELIKLTKQHFTKAKQIGCFDTAFYNEMPVTACLLPIPRRYYDMGVRRYGFHGLAYASVLRQFSKIAGDKAANGRIILAHLGSGASLTAIKARKPLDTTMSFTPASGVVMSSRSGDIDPGVSDFLRRHTAMGSAAFNHMVNFESGLLGISGTTADMKALIAAAKDDEHAKQAIDIFCDHIRKAIGSLSTVLGGVDSIIFSGGIGERSAFIRNQICANLDYLGINLDTSRNHHDEFLISADTSQVGIHVVHADEAAIIAHQTVKKIAKT